MRAYWLGMVVGLAAAAPTAAQTAPEAAVPNVAPAKAANDGTDPTRPVSNLTVAFEHIDLRGGFTADSPYVAYTHPFGPNTLRLKLPLNSVDVAGREALGLGDIKLKFQRVLTVNPVYGLVASAEMGFNTAGRTELGTGKNVLTLTGIYAKFLKGGRIFAPALVHDISLWGDRDRADISITTVDLYYVPKYRNPRLYATIDPYVSYDWVRDVPFGGLKVTQGYRLGPMLGGTGQMYVKPGIILGPSRPANWSIEAGFQLLNF